MRVIEIDRLLFNVLSNDDTLKSYVQDRVWGHFAPSWTSMPYVIFTLQSARDVEVVGGDRILLIGNYQVKAVGKCESWVPLRPIADRIDDLLHAHSYSDGGYRIDILRETPVSYVEIIGDFTQYRHLGGIYRIFLSET